MQSAQTEIQKMGRRKKGNSLSCPDVLEKGRTPFTTLPTTLLTVVSDRGKFVKGHAGVQ